jgi:hypothetical protein
MSLRLIGTMWESSKIDAKIGKSRSFDQTQVVDFPCATNANSCRARKQLWVHGLTTTEAEPAVPHSTVIPAPALWN